MIESNLEALKNRSLAEIIQSCSDDNSIDIGNDFIIYDNIELDSKLLDIKNDIKSIDTIFLIGFGFGNQILELRKKYPKTLIVILEFEPCIIKKTLEHRDLSELFNDDKIIFVVSKDEALMKNNIWSIVKFLERRISWGNYFIFVINGYSEVFKERVDFIKEEIYKNVLPIITNRSTLLAKSKNIVGNTIKNIPNIAEGGSIAELIDLFRDKPAIVVASGPSLSKNINILKEIKDKAIIIAIDSVLSVLDRHDIEPDFVCGVDFQEINMGKYTSVLRKKEKDKSIFVAADGIYYGIPKLFDNSFFDYSEGSVTSLYFKDLTVEKKRFSLNAVTHLAVQLAYFIGAKPIIFVGQDWAFSYGQDHAEGSSIEGVLPENVIWVKGNYENKVPTSPTLYSGLKLVEDMVRLTKPEGFVYINSTEGGAFIDGTEVMTLKEAGYKYLHEKIDRNSFLLAKKSNYEKFITITEEILKRLEWIIRNSSKCVAINEKVLKKWVKNKNVSEIKKDVDKVNKINDEITFDRTFNSLVANYFFKDFYEFNKEEIDIEGQDIEKRIKQSLKYFRLIKDRSMAVKGLISELLNFLKLKKEFLEKKQSFFKNRAKVLKFAELLYELKALYDGLEFIKAAINENPSDANYYYWKAKYCTLNRFMHKEALKNFEKALELDPNFEKALFDYEVEKKMVQSHMILAKQAAERKDYISAKRLIDRALDYEPENEELKRWKGIIEELAKATKNAQKQNLLLKQLELEGEAFEKYKTAIEFVKKEQMGKAFDMLKELYSRYGNFADIPFLLGSIYIDKKELDKAEKYLKEAVELIPYQPLVYLALGKLYIEKEDYLAAKENLEKAISMNPDLKPGVLDTLGNLYYEFGEYEKAFRAFEEYLQYSDDKIKTLTKIALCYKEMGMIKEYNMLMDKIKSITGAN